MSTEIMYEVLPDIPRFYTALAEWLACMICIWKLRKRSEDWHFVVVSAGVLAVQSAFLVLTDGKEGLWWILCMAIAIGMMYLFILISCDISRKDGGYYCVRAFVVAEFMAALEWEVECFFYYEMHWKNPWNSLFWLIVIYGGVGLICCLIEQKGFKEEEHLEIENRELISCVIIGGAVFLMSNLGYTSLRTPFSTTLYPGIFIIRTMIDFGGTAILYAYHMQRVAFRIRCEYESIQTILHNQYAQYKQSKDVIELINYKYHDLKHYILAIKSEESPQKRDSYLDQIEEELGVYDVQCRTGHHVLDTLLTSKNLYCTKNKINMTCVVDGTLFDFMTDMDICSIFGNALDNAIECEKKLPEGRRMIEVSAFLQRNFLIIRFENYCEGAVEFHTDLPVTTKEDSRFHGYGLKSLCYTVRKYEGETDISVDGNWFSLKILIPMKPVNNSQNIQKKD